jgi:hypothetical protein
MQAAIAFRISKDIQDHTEKYNLERKKFEAEQKALFDFIISKFHLAKLTDREYNTIQYTIFRDRGTAVYPNTSRPVNELISGNGGNNIMGLLQKYFKDTISRECEVNRSYDGPTVTDDIVLTLTIKV